MIPDLVPCLPENAPFTPEQRAYLNGFLAGLFSRAPAPAASAAARPSNLRPLTILFGSQTGTAEKLARRLAKEATRRGFVPTVHDVANYDATGNLVREKNVLLVASTYGDGEPPDSAKTFWSALSGSLSSLASVKFSVCALGDTNYPKFCAFGKALDARLQELGATPIHPRADCDTDYETAFAQWMNQVLSAFGDPSAADALAVPSATAIQMEPDTSGDQPAYGRENPFPGLLIGNARLNAPGSAKETRHLAFSLEGSGLSYEAGDALGVMPGNCPELVDELLRALRCSGDVTVKGRQNEPVSLREAFLAHYEISRIPAPLLQHMAQRTGDAELLRLTAPGVNGELTKFLHGRDIVDLLNAFSQVEFSPENFLALLKKLQPRLYSISSSPQTHSGEVHLTVGVVRYAARGRQRKGVCSTYLADRAAAGQTVPLFIHQNRNFRLPADAARPVIMVGPGTGIAPFRGFLHERRATGAAGPNWLFFGDQHAASDFLYQSELKEFVAQGTLNRLDTAFSRDQAERIYVQHRMRAHAREIYDWLERGAYFYVCGDASRMARDVDQALHEIIATASGRTPEAAADYVGKLQAEKRYQRDVY